MYWLHFTREFYRAGKQPVAAPAAASPAISGMPDASAESMESAVVVPIATVTKHGIPTMASLEGRIRELEAALAISDRSREAFLSSMSHELRTPLNAIMGFSEMMKEGVFGAIGNPTYHQYAGHIHESGGTLLSKINDLLDIASLDAGGVVIEEQDFVLTDLFQELVEMHSHGAFARNQTLRIDCVPGIRLFADRRKLLCALSHFLTNAMRHSPEQAQILIMARIQPDDGVILSVRDEGEGIAPAQLSIIRQALQQDSSYKHIEPGGLGLGLALSRELADQHDGRLMIDSIRHRGTVVSMILPKERILAGMPAKRRRSL